MRSRAPDVSPLPYKSLTGPRQQQGVHKKIIKSLNYRGKRHISMYNKEGGTDVRGVLGNKCAGQHNLKTVHFRDTLASGNFWAWSSAICVFFCSALP